jgi:hypothetical protein
MKNAIKWLFVAALPFGAAGCPMGSAKVFAQDQGGGTLILEGDEGKAMEDANKKMALHCGMGNFQVVKRETVVVGHENYADSYATQQATQDSQQAGVVSTSGQTTEDSASQGSSAAVVGQDPYSGEGYAAEGHQDSSSTTTTNDQTTVAAGAQSTQVQGSQQASSVSGTREVRENRVTYACGGGAPAPAPAPAG